MTATYDLASDVPEQAEEWLRATVRALAANLAEQELSEAVERLLEAVENYRSHFPIKSGQKRVRPSLSETRKSLRALLAATGQARKAAGALPIAAQSSIRKVIGRRITVADRLDGILHDVTGAIERLRDQENRAADNARVVLASDVARILRDNLGIKPSLTRADSSKRSQGAAGKFDTLLRVTIRAAGGSPPEDLMALMIEGRRLLKEFQTIE